jgi:hypothetical protein
VGVTSKSAATALERHIAGSGRGLVVLVAAQQIDSDRGVAGGRLQLCGALPPTNTVQERLVAGVIQAPRLPCPANSPSFVTLFHACVHSVGCVL